jgi:hypothetical protein
MLEILESLYPQGNWAAPKTKWTKILSASDNRFDKIRIARALVEEGKLTLDYLDLRSKICELANFIRQSSGNLV